jgi:single-stranded-DNA-specific exonuclease
VVGIVASRIIESHYKPTVVLTRSNGHFSGSARSVEGFDLYAAISKCEDLLEQFGGHTHAAGMTLLPENVEKFANRFEEVVKESIEVEQLTEQLEIDIEIGFDQLFTPEENRLKIPRLKRILNQFEPHGPGNMKPVFVSRNVFATDVRVLKDAHLKLRVVQPNSDVAIDAIGFNLAHKEDEVASGIPFDLAYTIETNRWNGKETIQLNIKDIREVI